MKPAPFTYVRPATLPEALGFLAEHPDDAKPLAGGQSLLPMLNLRLARIPFLVDIGRLPGLADIRLLADNLEIGALTRHRDLVASDLIRERAPLLAECAPLIGHPAIRNRGTLGGSLAHADPAAELPTALVAHDATLMLAARDGTRELPIADFFIDTFMTALAPGELLVGARIPPPAPGSGWAFLEIARRHGDFAVVAAAAGVTLGADGTCADCRLVLSGVAPVPYRAHEAEALLRGRPLTPGQIASAGRMATATIEPIGDLQASAAYKRQVARVYAERALSLAAERAFASASLASALDQGSAYA